MGLAKRITAKGAVVALVAGIALSPASAAQAGGEVARGHGGDAVLRQELLALTERPDGPPGVIAVLDDNGRTKVYRAGLADLAGGRPPSAHEFMRLASASKAYSGAVALSLVRCGLLRLDDTLAQRLPQVSAAWAGVTVRQLLNHTSGLPDYSAAQSFRDLLIADPHHVFDSRRLLEFVADRPLRFPAGSRYEYSNSDNIAVALIAEAVTGRRYEDLLASQVSGPLGLHRTYLPSGFEMPEPYMRGYVVDPPDAPEDVSELFGMSGVWASGAITTTPIELGAFMRAWASGSLSGPDAYAEQITVVDGGASEPAGPGRNDAGLGIFRYTTRCGVVYGHTGNTAGYTQLAASTADGRRSLTFSVNVQVNKTANPDLLQELRAVQEDFVCALLNE